MSIKINYIDSIMKTGMMPVKDEHLVTRKILEKKYKIIKESLDDKFSWNSEQERLEHKIEFLLAYLNIMAAVREKVGEDPEDKPFNKYEVALIAKQNEYNCGTASRIILENEDHNEYHDLKCPNQASISRLKTTYLAQLKKLEEELMKLKEEGCEDQQKISKIQSVYLVIRGAYERMSDPSYKLRKDERFLMGFNPNKEKLYTPRSFADVSYIPRIELKRGPDGQETIRALSLENFQGDKIQIIKTADTGFGRFRQKSGKITFRDSEALEEYVVLKRYADPELRARRKEIAQQEDSPSMWYEDGEKEVFTVYTNLNRNLIINPSVDPEYVKVFADALFSTYNMEEAIRHNGGYIGEVTVLPSGIQNRNKTEYGVVHNRDYVCLAKEISSEKKKRQRTFGGQAFLTAIDRRGKEGKGTPGGER